MQMHLEIHSRSQYLTRLKNAGSESSVEDQSDLTNIKNVKGDETFSENGDSLTWNTDGSDIYYQGQSNKDLPVSVKFTYFLDGQEMQPQDLVGKSGHLQIKIQYTNNEKKSAKVDGKNVQHRLIRRVSMDQFYAILTGEEDAFYKMCMALPEVINSVVNEEGGVEVPHDTVIDELRKVESLYGEENGELSMAMAVYMLGFNTYMGFGDKNSW